MSYMEGYNMIKTQRLDTVLILLKKLRDSVQHPPPILGSCVCKKVQGKPYTNMTICFMTKIFPVWQGKVRFSDTWGYMKESFYPYCNHTQNQFLMDSKCMSE